MSDLSLRGGNRAMNTSRFVGQITGAVPGRPGWMWVRNTEGLASAAYSDYSLPANINVIVERHDTGLIISGVEQQSLTLYGDDKILGSLTYPNAVDRGWKCRWCGSRDNEKSECRNCGASRD